MIYTKERIAEMKKVLNDGMKGLLAGGSLTIVLGVLWIVGLF